MDSFTSNLLTYSSTIVLGIVAVIITILVYARRGSIRFGSISLEFGSSVEVEAEKIARKLATGTDKGSVSDKQFVLLQEYHAQGLAQSKVSFYFSLIFASLGFVVILLALLTTQVNVALLEQPQAFVGLASGTIIDAVSGLFFVQSNKARQLMIEFFDKLRTDRKLDESLKLSGNISDPLVKSRLQALLALNFAEVKSTDGILSAVLNAQVPSEPRQGTEQSKT